MIADPARHRSPKYEGISAPKRLPRGPRRGFTDRFQMSLPPEIARRRTFAIISHPDAGKTTLTEKFLLYGNAIHLAGAVKDRKNQRATTSDWMELEGSAGSRSARPSCSSTTTAPDQPARHPRPQGFLRGHLPCADSRGRGAHGDRRGKGVETQTRKLFEVCRRRGIPIFTFMNKCDRPTLNPMALLDELEAVLGIHASPMDWPLGTGSSAGCWTAGQSQAHFFERAPAALTGCRKRSRRWAIRRFARSWTELFARLREELEMLDGAGHLRPGEGAGGHADARLLRQRREQLRDPAAPRRLPQGLDPAPAAHVGGGGVAREVPVTSDKFSAFIFKIQANMDPRHRDRIAFMRVCSGKFERDMAVLHVQTGKTVRLSSSTSSSDRTGKPSTRPGRAT